MAAPTFVAERGPDSWSSEASTRVSDTFTPAVGDVVVGGLAEENLTSGDDWGFSNTGGAETWTEVIASGTANSDCFAEVAHARITSWTGAGALTATRTGGGVQMWGLNTLQFTDTSGVGASAVTTTSHTIDITTTQDDSAVVIIFADWNATDWGVSPWVSVNAAAPVEVSRFRDSTRYTVGMAYYANVGAKGLKTVGFSSAGTGSFVGVAIEIKAATDLVGSSQLVGGDRSSIPVPVPAGAAAQDIAVVGLFVQSANAVTPPDGSWTVKYDSTFIINVRLVVLWKRLTAADSGTWTFTTPTNQWVRGVSVLVRGRRTLGDPFMDSDGTPPSSGSTTVTVPSLDAQDDDVLVGIATSFNDTSWTPPAGMTELRDWAEGMTLAAQEGVAAGATGPLTFTASSSSGISGWVGSLGAKLPSVTVRQRQLNGGFGVTTATLPADPVQGNLLVAVAAERSGATSLALSEAGWLLAGEKYQSPADSTYRKSHAVWYKYAGASESRTVTLVVSTGGSNLIGIAELEGDPGIIASLVAPKVAISGYDTVSNSYASGPTDVFNATALLVGFCYTKVGTGTETPYSDWSAGPDVIAEFTEYDGGGSDVDGSWALGVVSGSAARQVTATKDASSVGAERGAIVSLLAFPFGEPPVHPGLEWARNQSAMQLMRAVMRGR